MTAEDAGRVLAWIVVVLAASGFLLVVGSWVEEWLMARRGRKPSGG